MVSKYKWIIFLIVILGLLGFHYVDKQEAVNAAIAKKDNEMYEAILKENAKRLKTEKKLKEERDSLVRKKDEQIKNVNNKLNLALDELRKRPSRSDANTSIARDSGSCTGAQLFREDAEFLTREAARADQLIIERDYYYEQYESARRNLAGEETNGGRRE